MAVRCPYCQHQMELKGAHAGRFKPKCTACKERFVLVVPEDPSMPPLVGELPKATDPTPEEIAAIQDSIAGASQAGLTAAGVNAVSATVAPPSMKATQAPAKVTQPAPRPAQAVAQTIVPPSAEPAQTARASRTMADVTAPPPSSKPSPAPMATMPPPAGDDSAVGLGGSPGDIRPRDEELTSPRTMAKETYVAQSAGLTGTLGGYEIQQKLGEGGMGAVYLARQVSLDRSVALKVLSPELAADPEFVARFTREAYAAAQLAHHNVVQIHDIGFDRETNFFSMEYVPGQTLEKLVKGDGKLDPEVAVGYVLQAARGLRFAHDHGLIHRDVKPDNLLLNEQGIVKVADLGLVKQAGKTEITRANTAKAAAAGSATNLGSTQFNVSMGTPAYMPPEQARDAAHVDQRADIYSLGCTLYDLLTGAPPFNGKTVVEVITKHQNAAAVPPDRVARHVSPELSGVVMKMMAKRPEDRYQTMAEVVESLEDMLGIESGKPFSPKDEHVRVLEGAVGQFNGSKWAKLRTNLILGFYAICGVGAVTCALPQAGNSPFWAGVFVGFAVLTTIFYQALVGITRKTHLFATVRSFVFGARLIDWLKFLGAAAVTVLLLVAFNLHWPWLTAAILAACAAAAFHFSIDRLADAERKTPLGHVEGMLKKMRLRGLDETSLRQFVCKYSGERWEEMYETLFGYEAKRAARRSWGKSDRGRNRRKFAAWRDHIIDWVERRMVFRKEERERKLLAKIEAKALAAKGLDQASANRKAKQAADKLMTKAAKVKESADKRMMMTVAPTSSGRTAMFDGAKPLASFADGFTEEEESDAKRHRKGRDGEREHEGYFKRRFGTPLDYLLGPHPRVLLAVALLVLFGLWMRQNTGVTVSDDQLATRTDAAEIVKQGATKVMEVTRNYAVKETKPLRVPFAPIPDRIEDLAGSYNGGVAGALLLVSAFFIGKRLGIAVLLAAAFILIGAEQPIPIVQGSPWIAAGIGTALGLLGIMFFRKTAADS